MAIAWGFVRSIDYWLWGLENGLRIDPLRCQRVPSALAPMAEQSNLAQMRFTIGIFLAGLGALMLFHGYHGWAALPLAGAALHFSIAYLDITVARSAPLRTSARATRAGLTGPDERAGEGLLLHFRAAFAEPGALERTCTIA